MNELHQHPVSPRELLPSLRRRLRGAVGTKTEARCFTREYVCILLTDDGHRRGVRGNSIGWKPRNPRMLPPVAVRSLPDPLHRVFVREAWRHSQTTRNSPLFGQNSRTNAEGFGKLIEVAFQQMNLASNISSEIAFRYVSKSLA